MQKTTICLCLVFMCWLPVPGQAASRVWVDNEGRRVQAEYAGMQGDSVLLKLPGGNTVPFPLARLSKSDQDYVRFKQGRSSGPGTDPSPGRGPGPMPGPGPIPGPGSGPGASTGASPGALPDPAEAAVAALKEYPRRVPIQNRTWPDTVAVSAGSIEIQAVYENVRERQCIYQSKSFEFSSQAKLAGSVMKEVARTFEATRALVEAMPWGILCLPPDGKRFKAALYETREDYIAEGGAENSGGMYLLREKIFKIPFPSLGLRKRGQTYFKDEGYTNATLVHELTHQMMDEYLEYLPIWVCEGTAEYTEMMPYNAGTFRPGMHKTSMKSAMSAWESEQGFAGEMGSLQEHMTMPQAVWAMASSSAQQMSIMYHRSHMLVYFFNHLDGDRQGTRFIRFMEAVHGEVAAKHAFFADPRVKQLGDGRFSYPQGMTLPSMDGRAAFKHLPILLDGRSYEELARDFETGFRSIGVKVQAE